MLRALYCMRPPYPFLCYFVIHVWSLAKPASSETLRDHVCRASCKSTNGPKYPAILSTRFPCLLFLSSAVRPRPLHLSPLSSAFYTVPLLSVEVVTSCLSLPNITLSGFLFEYALSIGTQTDPPGLRKMSFAHTV